MPYKVIGELHAGKYSILELDRKIEDVGYSSYMVGGHIYPVVPVYDLPNNIAIESDEDHIGMSVECI